MSFVSSILGEAKDDVKQGVQDAGSSLLKGDITGAVSSIVGIPGKFLSNLGSNGGAPFGDGFAGMHARQDAVQDWCWYCMLPTIAGKSLPWYYVTNANTPNRQFNIDTVKRNGHELHYAESYTISGTLTLKFFIDSSSKAADYLQAWGNEVMYNGDPSQAYNQGIWGFPSGYKKTITVAVMSVEKKELMIFKYYGCFPVGPQPLDLTTGSSTNLEFSVEFQVEDVEVTVKNGMGFIDNLKDTVKGLAMGAITGGLTAAWSGITNSLASRASAAEDYTGTPV